MGRIVLLVTFAALLNGCAIHSPMSEMVMFKTKTDDFDGREYSAKYSHAFASYTADLYDPQVVVDYANSKSENDSYSYNYARSFATHAIFLSEKVDDFALSLAIGNTVGVDMTARLFGQTYLTGAANVFEGLQGKVILQQRIYDGNPVGLSFGATLSRNYQILQYDSGSMVFPGLTGYYTTSAGLRFVFMSGGLSFYRTSRSFFYVNGSMNYDFQMKHFYPRMGISFGLY